MKKRALRTIGLLLSVIMIFGVLCGAIAAVSGGIFDSLDLPTGGVSEDQYDDTDGGEVIGPINVGPTPIDPDQPVNNSFTSLLEAAEYVRSRLTIRENPIVVKVSGVGSGAQLASQIMKKAWEHTGVANEGDYLHHHMYGYTARYYMGFEGGAIVNTFSYTINNYYSTSEQEQAVLAELDTVMAGLNLAGKSDAEKIGAIYDYICDHVTYDYDSVVKTNSGNVSDTAYAALINGTANSQGYANLFYLMALTADVDCRLIMGTSDSGANHAWNLVKIGDLYYNVDCAWDASLRQNGLGYQYFLKGSTAFDVDHTRSSDFTSQTFMTSYPTSADDYYDDPLPAVYPGVDCAQFEAVSASGVTYDNSSFAGENALFIYGTSVDANTKKLVDFFNSNPTIMTLGGYNVIVLLINDPSDVDLAAFSALYPNLLVLRSVSDDSSCYDNLNLCGNTSEPVKLPVVFLKNSADKLIHYSTGPVSGNSVYAGKLVDLLATVPVDEPEENKEIPGDLTGDGCVDIDDVNLLLQHSIFPAIYPLECSYDLDFTHDGSIDIYDVVLLLQYSMFPELYPIF